MMISCTQAPEKTTGSVPIQQPAASLPEQIETVPEEAGFSISQNIKILGKSGFDPAEISIKRGDTLIWLNEDTKNMVLNIKKGTKPTLAKIATNPMNTTAMWISTRAKERGFISEAYIEDGLSYISNITIEPQT